MTGSNAKSKQYLKNLFLALASIKKGNNQYREFLNK